jgi:hypothetical protein
MSDRVPGVTVNVPGDPYVCTMISCTYPDPSPVRVIADPPLVADSLKLSEDGADT